MTATRRVGFYAGAARSFRGQHGDIVKVPVGRQHRRSWRRQSCQQRVNRADLDAVAPAFVSQFRRIDMVASVGNRERQNGELTENLRAVPRSRKALLGGRDRALNWARGYRPHCTDRSHLANASMIACRG